jgi:two-component system, NarL family, nitrate/nitrite response regulator NarL
MQENYVMSHAITDIYPSGPTPKVFRTPSQKLCGSQAQKALNHMTTSRLVRILMVDDHVSVRVGLKLLIELEPNFKVVGEATNLAEARAAFEKEKPDLILLDLDLKGEDGVDLIGEFTNKGARVLVFTGILEKDRQHRCLELGAKGLINKGEPPKVLLKAIEKVHQGEVWFDRRLMSDVLTRVLSQKDEQEDPEALKIATLTQREREVIALVTEGRKNKQIAERLYISDTTVRHHLTSIFSKLGVSDRLELVIYSYQYGLRNGGAKSNSASRDSR